MATRMFLVGFGLALLLVAGLLKLSGVLSFAVPSGAIAGGNEEMTVLKPTLQDGSIANQLSPGRAAIAQPSPSESGGPRSRSELPPEDARIADVFDDLSRRARAGDRQAGCRLALDLQLCAMRPMMQASIQNSIDAAAETGPSSRAETRIISNIAYMSDLGSRAERVCDGLSDAQMGMSWQFMLEAANQGSVAAAVRFAGLPPMDFRNFAADAEAWAAYRDNAPRLLEYAASQGDPRAIFLLSRILNGRNLLFGLPDGTIEVDRVRATAYASALLGLVDPRTRSSLQRQIADAESEMGPDDFSLALDMARQVEGGIDRSEPVIDFKSGIFNRMEPVDCEE